LHKQVRCFHSEFLLVVLVWIKWQRSIT
jgi:hypothetical protein